MKRTESFDPRPHSRQADLALKKVEFDADTASINRRTVAMNERAQRNYQAATAKPKAKPPAPRQGMLASAFSGMKRRLMG